MARTRRLSQSLPLLPAAAGHNHLGAVKTAVEDGDVLNFLSFFNTYLKPKSKPP
jgi:hypothetical protein